MRRGGQGGEVGSLIDLGMTFHRLPAYPMGARISSTSSRRSSRGGPRGGVEHPRSSRSAPGSTNLAPVARMPDWQRYLQPEKVEEALEALDSAGGRARPVAA